MTRVAIIGGGPGGLMTAHLLEQKCSCRTTLFEASDRLGGKVRTCRFDSAPVKYEAGVAECYDYEAIGDDPLRNLMRELGLDTTSTGSNAIVLDGALMLDDIEIGQRCGDRTLRAIEDFRRLASTILPVSKWYQGLEQGDNGHPWARRTFEEMLNEVADPVAKAYLKVAVHSDLATEPNLTNGLNGLRKLLGSVPGYGAQYSIDGGMEMLPRRLAEHLTSTNVVLNAPVVRVSGHEAAQPEPPESTSRWLRRFGPAGPKRCAALLRCSGRRVTAYVAARDRMDRHAVATRDGRARGSLQPAGPLSADLGPLRPAVLAPPCLRLVVHARCLRRLLRLRRRHPARCRRIRCARLAPGGRRRAGAL